MTIRALIFDFDGLILDTETPILRTWQELYAEHGHELPLDQWLRMVGTWEPFFDPAADLQARVGDPLDWPKLEKARHARESELVLASDVLPGVAWHIEAAREAGIALAIASSSSRDWVEGHLGRLGLLDRFDCIVTRDDVERTKPAPDLYLAAAGCLGVDPAEAVAIEDSAHGVAAAKAAGMRVAAVPTELTALLDLGIADVVVDSLASVPPIELWALLEE